MKDLTEELSSSKLSWLEVVNKTKITLFGLSADGVVACLVLMVIVIALSGLDAESVTQLIDHVKD